jgi:hypothetical protein
MSTITNTTGRRGRRGGQAVVPTLSGERQAASVPALRRAARTGGRRAGRAAALGQPHADRIRDLPAREGLATGVRGRIAEVRRVVQQAGVDARQLLERATHQEAARAAQARDAREDAAEAARRLEALPADHSPPSWVYLLVLLLLAGAELPTLLTALQTFPAGGEVRTLLAVVLSGVLAAAAHYLARTLRTAVDERGRTDGGRRPVEVRLLTGQIVLLGGTLVGLIVFMGLTRGESFAVQAELTGGLFGSAELLSGLMVTLQLVLLAIALAAGLLHAQGEPRRRLTWHRRRAAWRAWRAERHRARLGGRRAALQEELAGLPETERLWIAREEELLAELLARHDEAYERTEHSLVTRLLARLVGRRLEVEAA